MTRKNATTDDKTPKYSIAPMSCGDETTAAKLAVSDATPPVRSASSEKLTAPVHIITKVLSKGENSLDICREMMLKLAAEQTAIKSKANPSAFPWPILAASLMAISSTPETDTNMLAPCRRAMCSPSKVLLIIATTMGIRAIIMPACDVCVRDRPKISNRKYATG